MQENGLVRIGPEARGIVCAGKHAGVDRGKGSADIIRAVDTIPPGRKAGDIAALTTRAESIERQPLVNVCRPDMTMPAEPPDGPFANGIRSRADAF